MNQKQRHFEYEGKRLDCFFCGNEESPVVVLLNYEKQGNEIMELVPQDKFNLIEVTGLRWNDELSPWKREPAFHGGESFGGNGYAFLAEFARLVLPLALREFGLKPKSVAIAGYSLAGMFALYAGSRCDSFDALLSVSGSLWFDDFSDFIQEHGVSEKVHYVYLSLGREEPETKNKILCRVGEETEKLRDYYCSQGIVTDFVWNEGGHFVDAKPRIASAIEAYLNHLDLK